MPAPTPSNWRTAIVNMTISLLVAAIALHVAAELIRSVAVELIVVFAVVVIACGLWTFVRFWRSRW